MNYLVLFILLISELLHAQNGTPTSSEANLYPEGVISLPSDDQHFSKFLFVVGKKERTLWVYERQGELLRLVEKFDTDIGKNHGDKKKENDQKTPTGIYFLQKKLAQPEIPFNLYGSLAFTTDYPNIFDKRDYKTGSGIWLHAIPDSVPLTRGSRGCVVVRDHVIKKLQDYVKLKQTPIVIFDEIRFVSETEHLETQKRYLEFFQSWRKTWEEQDVDSYIKYYDSTFKNAQMNYTQWYQHKKNLKKLYKYIKVQLGSPLIIQNKDQVVIRTLQHYESDLHKDFGEKTIHARTSPEDGIFGFKIIREDWLEVKQHQASAKQDEI